MKRFRLPYVLIPVAALLLFVGAGVLYAQLEGSERGIPPIDSTSNLEVSDVRVDVTADNAEAARQQGWHEAQRRV